MTTTAQPTTTPGPTTTAAAPCGSLRPACSVRVCGSDDFYVHVYPRVYGNTVVAWDASGVIEDPSDLEAQIEISRYGVTNVNAWTIVQAYAANTGIWTDTSQHIYGTSDNLYYRVALRLPDNSVVRSEPVRTQDSIPKPLKATFNEILRRWENRGRRGELRRGRILKSIRYGNRCTSCRDRDSSVQLVSQCATCYGVGWVGGYYIVPKCVYAEMSPVEVDENFSIDRGFHSDGPKAQIKLMNIPQLYPGDVWVEDATDHRWLLGAMVHAQTVGTVELLTTIQTARFDFTHVVYQFPVV